MIFTPSSILPQIDALLEKYPDLSVVRMSDSSAQLHGFLPIHRSFRGFVLNKTYLLDIHIPLNSDRLPYVIDYERIVAPDYHHIYGNGELCLETDTNIRLRFIDGFDLVAWAEEYIELYFLSYEYYMRYGFFPFGERGHGVLGILQTYQDLFSTPDLRATYSLMHHVAHHPYRGHTPCPCGSNRHLRSCHGSELMQFYQDDRHKAILQQDFTHINKELRLANEFRFNQNATKPR